MTAWKRQRIQHVKGKENQNIELESYCEICEVLSGNPIFLCTSFRDKSTNNRGILINRIIYRSNKCPNEGLSEDCKYQNKLSNVEEIFQLRQKKKYVNMLHRDRNNGIDFLLDKS